MTDTTLGQRIAERRKLLGLSQEAFGEKMGVSRQAISKWESDTATPEIEKLITMSKLFDVSIGWLLGTEGNEQDLSAQIKAAFQPPKVEPPTPKPPAEPAPDPQGQEKTPALVWLNIICVVLAVASLMLSILSIGFRDSSSTSGDPATDSALAERVSQLEAQLQRIEALEMQEERLTILNHNLSTELTALSNKLDAALEVGLDFTPPLPAPPANTLPQYDSLSDWSMTAVVNSSLHKVTITFTATPAVDIQSAQFIATHNEETATIECELRDGQLVAELYLIAENDYQYTLLLTHTDDAVETIILSGHGLSDLGSLTEIRLALVEWDGTHSSWHDEEKFVMGWKAVFLRVPDLVDENIKCQWSNLRICYYNNEDLVKEVELDSTAAMEDMHLHQRVISFSIPTLVYALPHLLEGDRHELRLEGTLNLNDISTNFSLPLASWLIKNQTVVRQ